jgi:hypothetical protein
MVAFPVTVRSTDKTQSLALRATPRELNAAPNGQYAKKQIRTTSQVGWWAVCSCERSKIALRVTRRARQRLFCQLRPACTQVRRAAPRGSVGTNWQCANLTQTNSICPR